MRRTAPPADVHISCSTFPAGGLITKSARMQIVASERSMQSLRQLISRVRAWRVWRRLRVGPAAPTIPPLFTASRPIYRHVTSRGVRVYSLCGSCGAQLAASATLCDACARSRSTPNS
jgi:hypothetical protein